jgi:hypothetical protein
MRVRRTAAVLGLLGVLAVVPAANAAPAVSVIEIHVVFDGPEIFTASGGVVCANGEAVTDPVFAAGFGAQGRGSGSFHLIKTLTCDDGSGTFLMLVNAATAPSSPGTLGGFAIVGGTGDYTGLRGAGTLVGTNTDDGIDDVYTGRLHTRG